MTSYSKPFILFVTNFFEGQRAQNSKAISTELSIRLR